MDKRIIETEKRSAIGGAVFTRYVKRPVLWGIAFFATIWACSVGYSAYSALSSASAGQTLSKDAWNLMVANFSDHETRLAGLAPIWWEATSWNVVAPTSAYTAVIWYSLDSSTTWGGFNATTGNFQPAAPGRYLITAIGYSGVSNGWWIAICKNALCSRSWWSVSVAWNGALANISKIVYLNGTTDVANVRISNHSWTSLTISEVNATWAKLP